MHHYTVHAKVSQLFEYMHHYTVHAKVSQLGKTSFESVRTFNPNHTCKSASKPIEKLDLMI
jgi:hypothetical protein